MAWSFLHLICVLSTFMNCKVVFSVNIYPYWYLSKNMHIFFFYLCILLKHGVCHLHLYFHIIFWCYDHVMNITCTQTIAMAWTHLVGRGMFSADNCLWRLVVYTEHHFHPILGFRLSSQALIFTLNWDSRKGYLHRQWFSC